MARHIDRDELIRRFDLQPHPEGGFFRETYRSADAVHRESSADARSASTAIYYLLCDGAHSAWHRIKSDEVWHFYAGDPLNVYVLEDDGSPSVHRLGNALEHSDCVFQAVVSSGRWFAAQCDDATMRRALRSSAARSRRDSSSASSRLPMSMRCCASIRGTRI